MFAKGNSYKEDLLEKVSELQILHHYFGVCNLPTVICSPLRSDTNPSLGLTCSAEGKVYFTDFATGDKGDLFTLLQRYLNKPWQEVLNTIDSADITKTASIPSAQPKTKYSPKPRVSEIKIRQRAWAEWDKEYWRSYGLSKKFLEFCKVVPISHTFLYTELGEHIIPAEKYAYAYIEFKDGVPTYKIYQPFSTKFKWLNKHSGDTWDMWEQLPQKGDTLIITSSRKDAMCIWNSTGIPATSLQAESYLPKESVINELKSRFANIYILYDNDFTKKENWGTKYGKLFSKTFELTQLILPEEFGAKDSSDLFQKVGKTKFITIINSLLTKTINYIDCPF